MACVFLIGDYRQNQCDWRAPNVIMDLAAGHVNSPYLATTYNPLTQFNTRTRLFEHHTRRDECRQPSKLTVPRAGWSSAQFDGTRVSREEPGALIVFWIGNAKLRKNDAARPTATQPPEHAIRSQGCSMLHRTRRLSIASRPRFNAIRVRLGELRSSPQSDASASTTCSGSYGFTSAAGSTRAVSGPSSSRDQQWDEAPASTPTR
jgi:hypothetical protein